MAHENNLSDKSFDQQLQYTNGRVEDYDIAPNRRISGEIVLEPMGTGMRVTARDANHHLLWGYVASADTVHQIHCTVATYQTLQDLVAEELKKRGALIPKPGNPMDLARKALDLLDEKVKWMRENLQVQKVSEATLERARSIAQIASDAERQITLEAVALKIK